MSLFRVIGAWCWTVAVNWVRAKCGGERLPLTSGWLRFPGCWQAAALLASVSLSVVAAHAGDATWLNTPANSSFNAPPNWETGSVPTGTASFNTSNITSLAINSSTTIGGWTFNTSASAYTFNMGVLALTFNGAGILINGSSASITNIHGNIDFSNSSTAGSATIANDGGVLSFNNTSTAGSATITNNVSASAHGMINFNDTSTAGSSTITNNANTLIDFSDTSTAGNSTTTNNGSIQFFATSTAGTATITNNGSLFFDGTSTGGSARLINGAAGLIDLSSLTGAGITTGSIGGGGTISLGLKNLAVGGNNLSTTFSGALQDGGRGGGIGGSLTKVGHRHAGAYGHRQHLHGCHHDQRRHAGGGRLDRNFVGAWR